MATTVPLDYQMLIDGELVDSDGGRFAVTNPANGEEITAQNGRYGPYLRERR